MVDALSQRLVPDGLWVLVEPLLPKFETLPQGGGTASVDERAVFTAVVFVLTSGCASRMLPPFGGHCPDAASSPIHRLDRGQPLAAVTPRGVRRTG